MCFDNFGVRTSLKMTCSQSIRLVWISSASASAALSAARVCARPRGAVVCGRRRWFDAVRTYLTHVRTRRKRRSRPREAPVSSAPLILAPSPLQQRPRPRQVALPISCIVPAATSTSRRVSPSRFRRRPHPTLFHVRGATSEWRVAPGLERPVVLQLYRAAIGHRA